MGLAARCTSSPLALAIALAASLAAAEGATSHFACRVTSTAPLWRLGRSGQDAELSQFTCRVSGGLLDGFVATGTNIWEPARGREVLLGSIVVLRKGDSAVVYEVQRATRKLVEKAHGGPRWEGAGHGTYKLATGSAAALAGKTFHTIARREGPDTFSIDATVGD